MNRLLVQSDRIGIIASTLCIIHCLMTPVLFVVKACSTSCAQNLLFGGNQLTIFF